LLHDSDARGAVTAADGKVTAQRLLARGGTAALQAAGPIQTLRLPQLSGRRGTGCP
jgi:hypothetical protein